MSGSGCPVCGEELPPGDMAPGDSDVLSEAEVHLLECARDALDRAAEAADRVDQGADRSDALVTYIVSVRSKAESARGHASMALLHTTESNRVTED